MSNIEDKVKINLFVIYSRRDSKLRDRLEIHLHSLKRKNYVNLWHDGEIEPGQDWKKQISKALTKADIILVLVSVDFIASDYCYEIEMEKALERHEKGEALIIPIILKDCDWQDTPIGELQALPTNGDPIIGGSWTDPESGFRDTAVRLKHLIEDRLKNKETVRKQLSEKINQLEKQNKILKQNKRDLSRKLATIQKEYASIDLKHKKQISKILELEKNKRNLLKSLEETHLENVAYIEDNKGLKDKIRDLHEENKSIRKDSQESIEKLKRELIFLEKDLDHAKDTSRASGGEMTAKIVNPQQPREDSIDSRYQENIVELKDEIRRLRIGKSYLRENEDLKSKVRKLEKEIKDQTFKHVKKLIKVERERDMYYSKFKKIEEKLKDIKE